MDSTTQTQLEQNLEIQVAPALPSVVAGLLAGAVAIGIGELVGSWFAPAPGPVTGVANQVIDKAPTWFVNFGKSFFGTSDKPALILGTLVLSAVFAGIVGLVARRNFARGALGLAAFGVVGFWAVLTDPLGGFSSAFFSAFAAIASGVLVLALLSWGAKSIGAADPLPGAGRRRFVGLALGSAGLAAFGYFTSGFFRDRRSAQIARDSVEIETTPVAREITESVAEAGTSSVAKTPGITPIVVPNDEYYRIDTATLVPQIDPNDWSLKVKGLVKNELTLTYDDLLERANWVTPVTLSCVSNEVGGGLVGNAVWQGFPLTDLLDEAELLPGATQIASRSVDGWDCGFPTELAYDGRTAMVAIAMNGEPLPLEHGFPARLVVSGLYGYVSATKWLSEIELTTIEGFNGFWIPRGWSKLGPVITQSRIDTPNHRQNLTAGETVPLAGIAFAPNLGIEKVEVQVDTGDWIVAELGESVSDDSWIQWSTPWTVTAGEHLVRVRATDKTGFTQIEERSEVAPSGATGWHSILVSGA